MKEIKVNELTDNLFETISKEWMLVTVPKTNSTS